MTAVFTYNYNSDYHPAMPMVEASIGLPMVDAAFDASGIVDSGADATIIPVRHLQETGARRTRKAVMRGVTGEETLVDLYAIAIRLGPYRQEYVEVVGDISGDEVIIGRDILNHLAVILNGPAGVVEVVDERDWG